MARVLFELKGEAETVKLGRALCRALKPAARETGHALCVYLNGDLGAGKTTLSRGFILESGYEGVVRSPTFTLVEPYEFAGFCVYHFDLYRLNDPDELEYLGIRDYFGKPGVCLFEWPQKAQGVLPKPELTVNLEYGADLRRVCLESDVFSEELLAGSLKEFA